MPLFTVHEIFECDYLTGSTKNPNVGCSIYKSKACWELHLMIQLSSSIQRTVQTKFVYYPSCISIMYILEQRLIILCFLGGFFHQVLSQKHVENYMYVIYSFVDCYWGLFRRKRKVSTENHCTSLTCLLQKLFNS